MPALTARARESGGFPWANAAPPRCTAVYTRAVWHAAMRDNTTTATCLPIVTGGIERGKHNFAPPPLNHRARARPYTPRRATTPYARVRTSPANIRASIVSDRFLSLIYSYSENNAQRSRLAVYDRRHASLETIAYLLGSIHYTRSLVDEKSGRK